MRRDWLWDRKISLNRVKKILKNPSEDKFFYYAALLLSRKNIPKEVFRQYLEPKIFCEHWQNIKKFMRKNKWADTSIEFWQAIYEKLKEKFKFKRKLEIKEKPIEPICKQIGENIRKIRKEKGLTQRHLAKRLKIAQQLISRVEKGYENPSVITLKKIASALSVEIDSFLK